MISLVQKQTGQLEKKYEDKFFKKRWNWQKKLLVQLFTQPGFKIKPCRSYTSMIELIWSVQRQLEWLLKKKYKDKIERKKE